jgi:type II secretory pathway component PulJ
LTLIEVIVASTLASAIFGIAVELLSVTMHSTESGRDRVVSTAVMTRLAEQFRSDVHAAANVSVDRAAGGQARWTLKLADDLRIEYEADEDVLKRIEYRGDKVQVRDAFAMPQGADPRLELQPEKNPTQASLSVRRSADATVDAAGYILRIEARLDRDSRFAKATDRQSGG